MKTKIFTILCFVAIFATLLSAFSVVGVLHLRNTKEVEDEVKNQAVFIAESLNISIDGVIQNDYLTAVGKKNKDRITLIKPDGTVIYDNFASLSMMGNHMKRSEVLSALKNGYGEAQRLSDTIGKTTYYYAILLDNGEILRVARNRDNILVALGDTLILIIIAIVIISVVSVIVSNIITKQIIKPINNLNLDAPLENKVYDELSPLLIRLDKQNDEISNQINMLLEKNKEIQYITNNISEGIIIFNQFGKVILANNTTKKLFSCREQDNYPDFCRNIVYLSLVKKSLNGENCNGKIAIHDKIFNISANAVRNEDKGFSVFLFIKNITETENLEKIRKEFSANVSHELKTPLTSIMGYAEIMENKVAKTKDIPMFSKKIYSEAKRLLLLIEDIIKLSQLDEQELFSKFEKVDLYEVCKTVAAELAPKADKRNISFDLNGETSYIMGAMPIIHEIIFNLCDNAITYNNENGIVKVSVISNSKETVLKVKDNGIGIASVHIDRIFERFYRVDKSRSKETGGTGLGLSIVKHGALMHCADLKVDSKLNKGTEMSVIFKPIVQELNLF